MYLIGVQKHVQKFNLMCNSAEYSDINVKCDKHFDWLRCMRSLSTTQPRSTSSLVMQCDLSPQREELPLFLQAGNTI